MGFQRVVNGRKTNKVIFKLKHAVQMLQSWLLLSVCRFYIDDVNVWNHTTEVDHNMGMVVEGHFPVVTMDDVPKRFFVALSYLTNPAFVKLLEEMEREFGFDQQGVLVIPCKGEDCLKDSDNFYMTLHPDNILLESRRGYPDIVILTITRWQMKHEVSWLYASKEFVEMMVQR